MVQITILSVLLGAVFGLRFKVPSLLLLNGVGFLAIGISAILLDQTFLKFAGAFVASTISTQVGYLLGSYLRFTVAAARGAVHAEERSQSKSVR